MQAIATSAYPLIGHTSRKRIAAFELVRPSSIDEALASLGPRTTFMAGGFDVVQRLKDGAPVERLVYLNGIADLSKISVADRALSIGAAATHQAVHESPLARALAPNVAAAFGRIGNYRVRMKATIGGNLMAQQPQYDVEPMALALGATPIFADDARRLLVAIEFPREDDTELLVDRSLRPALVLYVGLDRDGDRIVAARAAVGCAHPRPVVRSLRLPGSSRKEIGREADAIASQFTRDLPEPMTSPDASSAFRLHLAHVLLRRLLSNLSADS